jgi:hypothetical protein
LKIVIEIFLLVLQNNFLVNNFFKIFLFGLIAFCFSGCKKKNGTLSNADLKGNITLYVHVVHHTYTLSGINVYLQKGATNYPGDNPSSYEYSTVSDANGTAEFDNLPYGAIWVYGTGVDTKLNRSVVGNTGLELSKSYVGSGTTADMTLYVSE